MSFRSNLPGTNSEVNSVYSDACTGEPVPIGDTVDDLVTALEGQGSTNVVVGDVAAGSVPGKRVEVSETPGLIDLGARTASTARTRSGSKRVGTGTSHSARTSGR